MSPKATSKSKPKKETEKASPKKVTKTSKASAKGPKKMTKTPDLLRGFRDILPEEQAVWDRIRDTLRSMARAYSFDRIDLPVLEKTDVFERTVGTHTDIVEKEMYTFVDPSGDRVSLRPEATASIARAYIGHGMLNRPQPVKLWYMGQMFRHDRPQSGRFRQFHQLGFETIGVDDPIADAQLIVIAHRLLKDLGIESTVQINSIGDNNTRQSYVNELTTYFKRHRAKLGEDDKRRLLKNPLRILDSKDPVVRELLADAPQIVDWLDDASKLHFTKVLEFLDEVEVPYILNPFLVRGLDYYNRTVFEFWQSGDEGEKSQNALGGGGRYDGLIELMGGREATPAVGFALGVERIAKLIKFDVAHQPPAVSVFFAQLGDASRRVGLRLFEEFREANIPVAEAFGKSALKAQLDLANKLQVKFTLILGQKEVLDGTVIVRDMESGSQEIVDAAKVVNIIKRKLAAQALT